MTLNLTKTELSNLKIACETMLEVDMDNSASKTQLNVWKTILKKIKSAK